MRERASKLTFLGASILLCIGIGASHAVSQLEALSSIDEVDEYWSQVSGIAINLGSRNLPVFECANGIIQNVSVGKVRDGYCDCCDGSDEPSDVGCPDVCDAVASMRAEVFFEFASRHKGGVSTLKAWKKSLGKNKWQDVVADHGQRLLSAQNHVSSEKSLFAQRVISQYYGAQQGVKVDKSRWGSKGEWAFLVTPPAGSFSSRNPLSLIDTCVDWRGDEKQFRGGSPEPDIFSFIYYLCPQELVAQARIDDATGRPEEDVTVLGRWPELVSTSSGRPDSSLSLFQHSSIRTGLAKESAGQFRLVRNDVFTDTDGLTQLEEFERETVAVQRFSSGDPCWGGPSTGRQVKVIWRCSETDVYIDNVRENGKCEYEIDARSPIACSASIARKVQKKAKDAQKFATVKDEL